MADNLPSGLSVLASHLVAAGAALTDPLLDVDRGLPTGGKKIRYFWAGEFEPPRMPYAESLDSELVGQRFNIAALWPLSDLDPALYAALDIEMQLLAGQVRTRIDGDSTLGGNVTGLKLRYGEIDVLTIGNARHLTIQWELDIAFLEYTLAP